LLGDFDRPAWRKRLHQREIPAALMRLLELWLGVPAGSNGKVETAGSLAVTETLSPIRRGR
jgi:hypothetical protein